MLYPLLSKYIGFPLLGVILNGLYFGLIIAGIVLSAFLFFKQMARTGYDANRLRAFVVCSGVMIFPLGVISSRAANMFYFSPDLWSVSFFIEQFFSGPHQTFHAALILPFIFLMLLGQKFKFEKLIIWQEAMDFGEEINSMDYKFPKTELINLSSQFRTAAASIALNIFEGSIGQ